MMDQGSDSPAELKNAGWYNPESGECKIWNGSVWVPACDFDKEGQVVPEIEESLTTCNRNK